MTEPDGRPVIDPLERYKTERETLAMVLDRLIEKPVPPTAASVDERQSYLRQQTRNVYYAMALGAQLGYDVGVDEMGYAHIWLPFEPKEAGHLIFPVGLIAATGERPALWPMPARIRAFSEAVLPQIPPRDPGREP